MRLIPGPRPIPNLRALGAPSGLAELEQRMLRDFNEMHARQRDRTTGLPLRLKTFKC